ncbi:MAG: glutamine--fructose-6-phosphate transaminase (isomerizing) [Synergistaceae bacterium]|nr:glutamine--fructose-6-phosphate transaminase (isomerizing) [Synergistaceae bacterium]
MCGIMGYVGRKNSVDIIMRGLSSLEYRGYDSAGLAVLDNNEFRILKKAGKVAELGKMLESDPLNGYIGMGHTRWATHGGVTDTNAHPHRGGDNVVLIHNGIIENWMELKKELSDYDFVSETDTEVAACLIDKLYGDCKANGEENPTLEAIKSAAPKIRGAFAFVVMFKDYPDRFYCVRKSSPLVVGCRHDPAKEAAGKFEAFCASDAMALLPYTSDVVYMNEEIAELSVNGIKFWDFSGTEHKRETIHIDWNYEMAEKGNYPHFMLKEIDEQGIVLRQTIEKRITDNRIDLRADLNWKPEQVKLWRKLHIVACGTSYYASLVAERLAERFTDLEVRVDIASEYRYRNIKCGADTLAVFVSQSGETADTLAAERFSKSKGAYCLAVTNVKGSSLAREVDSVLELKAGPEIGVAATKTFMGQLAALSLLMMWIGKLSGTLSADDEIRICSELTRLPHKVESILSRQNEIRVTAGKYAETISRHGSLDSESSKGFLFIGRGNEYAIALEGALKLKEIAYVHAEAYAAGEMKHGPIALLDSSTPVIALAPADSMLEKTMSNIEEARARKSPIISVTTEGNDPVKSISEDCFFVPETEEELYPMLTVVPLQIFAYFFAFIKGCDIDKPRNLAKSVTVE